MNRDVEGGLFVIRIFLAIVFGFDAAIGMMIVAQADAMPWHAILAGMMVLPLLILFRLFMRAARQSLQFLTRRPQGPINTFTESVETVAIIDPAAPASPAPMQADFEAHLNQIRQQREYWRQKLQERREEKS